MTIVEIPTRLRNRPTFRGLVVPYNVHVTSDGRPDFKISTLELWEHCARNQLCPVCGEELGYWVWYLGGPTCVEGEQYFDLAMHEECARYSAKACPFVTGDKGYAQHLPDLSKDGLVTKELFAAPPAVKRVEMFLARGHRNKMRFDYQVHRVRTGTLVQVEKVERV